MTRANYLPAPHYFNLNHACQILNEAFGWGTTFLVGSSIERRDFRDVDVRCILADEDFDKFFPGLTGNPANHALWSIMCSSISLWLSQHTGLPVDFQIQRRTDANAKNEGRPRSALGMFYGQKKSDD